MQVARNRVLKYGFSALMLASLFLSVFFICWPYEKIQLLLQEFNRENDWLKLGVIFRVAATSFYFGQGLVLAIFCFSSIMVYRYRGVYSGSPIKTVAFFWQKLVGVWRLLPAWEKKLALVTLLLAILARLFFLHLFRVSLDEASTYILFLHKGLPAVLTYYPFPNNHVLYNLFGLPLLAIFRNPFWVLKLPAFAFSLTGLIVFYLGLRSVFRFTVAYVACAGLAFNYYALYYAVNGRGYTLLLLCTGLAALALLKIYEHQDNRYWLVFLLVGIAGFFTVPVFLYPFVSLLIFGGIIFWRKRCWAALGNLTIITLFTGITSLILYLPILLVSGPKQLFSNKYVVSQSFGKILEKLPVFGPYTQGAILGQETIGFYCWFGALILVSLLLVFKKRLGKFWQRCGLRPEVLFWVWCGSVIPWLMVLAQGVLPPERTWLFKSFADFLLLGIVLQLIGDLVFRTGSKWLVITAVTGMFFYSSYEVQKLARSVKGNSILDGPFDQNLTRIRQMGITRILSAEGYYSFFLRYEYLRFGLPNPIIDEPGQQLQRNYGLVILGPEDPFPKQLEPKDFTLIFSDHFVKIFRTKINP